MLFIGLIMMVIGIVLFLLPFVFNKFEDLILIGFSLYIVGGLITVIGSI